MRQFWVVAVAALVLAGAVGYLVVAWPGFRPRHVRVIGNRIVPTAEILARAGVDPHRNVWLQNTGAMARRIESIPYVLTARVHRRPPATVIIDVTERKPFANLRALRDVALVDASLRVLQLGEGSSLPTLAYAGEIALVPGRTVDAESIRTLREILLALRAHDVDATEVSLTAGEVTAILPGGVRVLLGDEIAAPSATALVEPILTRFALLGRPVRVLDLRSPTTPVVTESDAPRPPRVRRERSAALRPRR